MDGTEHAPPRRPVAPRLAPQPRTRSVHPTTAQVVHLDRAAWESCVRDFSDYSYRQAWAYGTALAHKRGATSEHVAIRSGSETIALADVRIKRLPLIGGGLAYISGGPLVRNLDGSRTELDRFDFAVDALVREYVHRRGLTLRIVAPI